MMIDLGVPMSQIILAAEQTVYMVFVSLFLGTILAIIMSVVLVLTNADGILKNKYVFTVLNTVINIIRSIPFIIDSGFSPTGHFHCALFDPAF